jgi:hypothetical protein
MARRVNKGMKAEKAAKAECGTQLAGSAELRRWQSWLVNTSGVDFDCRCLAFSAIWLILLQKP